MTNEEAIKMIKDDVRLHHDHLSGKYRKALSMAIEALSNSQKQSDSEIRASADAVSEVDVIYRADAIDMMVEMLADATTCMMPKDLWREVVTERISKLPSAQRTGEWIAEEEYGDLWVCDQCGFASEHNDNYCPNCGAEMKNNGDD